ncbi:MAG: HNH endonuclease [FCB group bacterium]|jgi:5-methylcytosine-specific restriction endonuclease McrA|nr:HNH endonuclease [FCB group bacterium]
MTKSEQGYLSREMEQLHAEALAIRQHYAGTERGTPERAALEERYREIDRILGALKNSTLTTQETSVVLASIVPKEATLKMLTLQDLPLHFYSLGPGVSGAQVQFRAFKDYRGRFFILAWDSAEAREQWIKAFNKDYSTFSADRLLFLKGPMTTRQVSFLIMNLRSDDLNIYADDFVVEALPPHYLFDFQDPNAVDEFLFELLRSTGMEDNDIGLFLGYWHRNSDISPEEAMHRFAAIPHTPMGVLREQGLYEDAMALMEGSMRNKGVPEIGRQLTWEVTKAHPELCILELLNLVMELFYSSIGALKAAGKLELLIEMFETQLSGGNMSVELISFAKDLVASNDELTFIDAMEAANSQLDARLKYLSALAELPEETQKAFQTCYPAEPCSSCGEADWLYVSVAPSGNAATWRCEYCGRKTIVRAEEAAVRNAGRNRQPIPKEVQLTVWQRDQGRCVECGSKEKLEFDHIIPLAKGGANTARNIQLLCEGCNRSKGSKAPGGY